MPIRDITLVKIEDGARAPVETATPDASLVPAP